MTLYSSDFFVFLIAYTLIVSPYVHTVPRIPTRVKCEKLDQVTLFSFSSRGFESLACCVHYKTFSLRLYSFSDVCFCMTEGQTHLTFIPSSSISLTPTTGCSCLHHHWQHSWSHWNIHCLCPHPLKSPSQGILSATCPTILFHRPLARPLAFPFLKHRFIAFTASLHLHSQKLFIPRLPFLHLAPASFFYSLIS